MTGINPSELPNLQLFLEWPTDDFGHRLVRLETPDQVHSLLARASNLRSVAATNMNERSSRSHSVFSLRVKGDNPLTGENCEVSRRVMRIVMIVQR